MPLRAFPLPYRIGVDICQYKRIQTLITRDLPVKFHGHAAAEHPNVAEGSTCTSPNEVDEHNTTPSTYNRLKGSNIYRSRPLSSPETSSIGRLSRNAASGASTFAVQREEKLLGGRQIPSAYTRFIQLLQRLMTDIERQSFWKRYKGLTEIFGGRALAGDPDWLSIGNVIAHLAGRWAAKEAAVKAVLSSGARGLAYRDVVVLAEQRKPYAIILDSPSQEEGSAFPGKIPEGQTYANTILNPEDLNGRIAHLSISHDGDYAVAICMAVDEDVIGSISTPSDPEDAPQVAGKDIIQRQIQEAEHMPVVLDRAAGWSIRRKALASSWRKFATVQKRKRNRPTVNNDLPPDVRSSESNNHTASIDSADISSSTQAAVDPKGGSKRPTFGSRIL